MFKNYWFYEEKKMLGYVDSLKQQLLPLKCEAQTGIRNSTKYKTFMFISLNLNK